MSSQQKRFKRVEPTQDGPLRNPANTAGHNQSRPFSDSMDSAVRTAYTVIDDYMRRGQEAASRYCGNNYHYNDAYNAFGDGTMNDPFNRDPYWQSPPSPFGAGMPWMWQMNEAMRSWMTMFYNAYRMPPNSAWPSGWPQGQDWNWSAHQDNASSSASSTGLKTDKSNSPAGSQPAEAPSAGTNSSKQGSSLVVKVSSDRPTEVIPSLGPGAYGVELIIEPLAHESGEAPSITGLHISCSADGKISLSVTVIPDQPVGRYTGSIKNAQGDIVGGLTVVLHE